MFYEVHKLMPHFEQNQWGESLRNPMDQVDCCPLWEKEKIKMVLEFKEHPKPWWGAQLHLQAQCPTLLLTGAAWNLSVPSVCLIRWPSSARAFLGLLAGSAQPARGALSPPCPVPAHREGIEGTWGSMLYHITSPHCLFFCVTSSSPPKPLSPPLAFSWWLHFLFHWVNKENFFIFTSLSLPTSWPCTHYPLYPLSLYSLPPAFPPCSYEQSPCQAWDSSPHHLLKDLPSAFRPHLSCISLHCLYCIIPTYFQICYNIFYFKKKNKNLPGPQVTFQLLSCLTVPL